MTGRPPPIVVADVKEVKAAEPSAVTLRVEAVVGGARSELEIAIATELAPQVALALLATIAEERSKRDDLAPALEPIGIGVVPSGDAEKVRLQLLFELGQVLPIEVARSAADRLRLALDDEFKLAE